MVQIKKVKLSIRNLTETLSYVIHTHMQLSFQDNMICRSALQALLMTG